jgi:hypothetical protein
MDELILDTFNQGCLIIESVTDKDGELQLDAHEVGRWRNTVYINKEHAEKIIAHLQKVFELGIAITE